MAKGLPWRFTVTHWVTRVTPDRVDRDVPHVVG
jgi:hypothetical protein